MRRRYLIYRINGGHCSDPLECHLIYPRYHIVRSVQIDRSAESSIRVADGEID